MRVALGVEQLAIAASGYGSYLALRYAQAHPDRVARLLLDPRCRATTSARGFWRPTLRSAPPSPASAPPVAAAA